MGIFLFHLILYYMDTKQMCPKAFRGRVKFCCKFNEKQQQTLRMFIYLFRIVSPPKKVLYNKTQRGNFICTNIAFSENVRNSKVNIFNQLKTFIPSVN